MKLKFGGVELLWMWIFSTQNNLIVKERSQQSWFMMSLALYNGCFDTGSLIGIFDKILLEGNNAKILLMHALEHESIPKPSQT